MENTFKSTDIIFETRMEAEEVLDRMREIVDTYASVTQSDLKDLAGLETKYEDTKYYWIGADLKYANILRVRDGYVIDLPAPNVQPSKSAKVSYRDYYYNSRPKTEPKPVWITVNTEEVENLDTVLGELFKRVATVPGREFHITIT